MSEHMSSAASSRLKRRLLMILGPLVVLIAGGWFYLTGGRYVSTDNAYLKADNIPLAMEVSGKVVDVLVAENQPVEAGQLLLRIDPASFETAVAQAQANVAAARTTIEGLKASYAEALAQRDVAVTNREFAERELKRQHGLAGKGYVSASTLDDASHALESAQRSVTVTEEDIKRIAASLGGDPAAPVEEHPLYKEALAALDKALLDQKRTALYAPRPGVVSQLPKIGQHLSAGSSAMALVTSDHIWVEANFNETDLTHVKTGQVVSICVDTYPDAVWLGEVESIAPATGSEFSVLPAENATGNWVKVVQRIPVRIAIKDWDKGPHLRSGMSTEVEIDTGHQRELFGTTVASL